MLEHRWGDIYISQTHPLPPLFCVSSAQRAWRQRERWRTTDCSSNRSVLSALENMEEKHMPAGIIRCLLGPMSQTNKQIRSSCLQRVHVRVLFCWFLLATPATIGVSSGSGVRVCVYLGDGKVHIFVLSSVLRLFWVPSFPDFVIALSLFLILCVVQSFRSCRGFNYLLRSFREYFNLPSFLLFY